MSDQRDQMSGACIGLQRHAVDQAKQHVRIATLSMGFAAALWGGGQLPDQMQAVR